MKDLMKALKITGIIILICVVVLFYIFFHHKSVLLKSHSPNENYKITVKYISPFFFGSHEIYVYYKQKNRLFNHKLFDTLLNNDGAAITESNCSIQWDDEENLSLTLTLLSGSLQSSISWRWIRTFLLDSTSNKNAMNKKHFKVNTT